jgi:Uma2 family endonuclease
VDNSGRSSVVRARLENMTALPQAAPDEPSPAGVGRPPPLTVAEFTALPEDTDRGIELQEGALVVSAKPIAPHQRAAGRLFSQLDAQAPAEYAVVLDVSVDLQLVEAAQPGTVRAPDLVVTTAAAYDRICEEGGIFRAEDVLLAVEIKSPSTRRMDSIVKHAEYADAGIGHYWIVDLDDGPSLTAAHLGGEFGYVDAEPVKGVFETDIPFPARVDLAALI